MKIKHVLLLGMCLGLSACIAHPYRVPDHFEGKSDLEIITLRVGQESDIRGDRARSYQGLDLIDVDGENVTETIPIAAFISEIPLLPGIHKVAFIFWRNGGFAWSRLWFIGTPGKIYIAKYALNRDQLQFSVTTWIEDAETGEHVGGLEGSSDEPH